MSSRKLSAGNDLGCKAEACIIRTEIKKEGSVI